MMQENERKRELNSLLSMGKYYGAEGALLHFKVNFLPGALANLKQGKIFLAVKYVDVIDRALTAKQDITLFQKCRTLYFTYVMNSLINKIRDFAGCAYSGYESDQLFILLSATVHSVQILEKNRLLCLPFFASQKVKFMKEIGRLSENIAKKGEQDKGSDYSAIHLNFGPSKRIALMAEALLFEFSGGKDADKVTERVIAYCDQNRRSRDRDILRSVCFLYRSVGRFEDAKEVALLLGSPDQIERSNR